MSVSQLFLLDAVRVRIPTTKKEWLTVIVVGAFLLAVEWLLGKLPFALTQKQKRIIAIIAAVVVVILFELFIN